jgi:hypothetical protein
MRYHTEYRDAANRYPLAELTVIKLGRPVADMDNESLLNLTEVLENLKRVKRERKYAEEAAEKEARKARKLRYKAAAKGVF